MAWDEKGSLESRYRGCLLGGALGDAMGYFAMSDEFNGGEQLFVSSSTQMTLFTANGVLLYHLVNQLKPDGDPWYWEIVSSIEVSVHRSYMRWLKTQGYDVRYFYIDRMSKEDEFIEPILYQDSLFSRRRPSRVCLDSLSSGYVGKLSRKLNNATGVTPASRVSPIGMYFSNPYLSYLNGCKVAMLTHGGKDAYTTSGAMAMLINLLLSGKDLTSAIQIIRWHLVDENKFKPTENGLSLADKLMLALELAYSDILVDDAIHSLGDEWLGSEALAIAIYCSAKFIDDFRQAIQVVISYNKNSNELGSICGSVLGAINGIDGLPCDGLSGLELSHYMLDSADMLYKIRENEK